MSRLIPAGIGVALALFLSASTDYASARTSLVDLDNKLDALLAASDEDPADIVVLSLSSVAGSPCSQGRGYRRVQLDGSTDPLEYVVPAGRILLIKEVHWRADDGPTNFVVNRQLYFNLVSAGAPFSTLVYAAPPVLITTSNQESLIGGNETLTTGVPFGPGRKVCASVLNQSQTGAALNRTNTSILRGVLVDQR